jgi:bacterioferritin-associated ferredoxin
MPYYEYHCETNGCTLEIRHRMSEQIETWGDLVERAGVGIGETPSDTPVTKLISAPVPITGSDGTKDFGGCGSGCGCVPQA